eukprot:CAMPEP_0204156692 /NCGR_PEP_ID=MMETSP0361-20130328/30639_1 /ASSEMBLY_ACC=CAM_ASM_000343 /TAXON_ID=268821 /ORGANISM="Scrippsiella Hangoei, Strain SHTV-5" /LENGTH=58 /DNA_ID=CAMNT_0051112355 /DNA_START=34 /DNA_END=207 /DNA_ORIENTATION=+
MANDGASVIATQRVSAKATPQRVCPRHSLEKYSPSRQQGTSSMDACSKHVLARTTYLV